MSSRLYGHSRVTGLRGLSFAVVCVSCLSGDTAFGWGRDGHAIVGLAAQPMLCSGAVREIARLSGGESLARMGQWADDIRRQREWAHSAPWHYVNIPDAGNPRNPPRLAEGDVMSAIERFSAALSDVTLGDADRAQALRFLVHFVADIHQPLHVGRAEDRGGNRIDVSYADTQTNLHAFWDTDAIRLRSLTVPEYAQRISATAFEAALRDRDSDLRDWAEQVFALRERVYDFDTATGALDRAYLDMAAGVAEEQLALAAAHLANTLNDALCR